MTREELERKVIEIEFGNTEPDQELLSSIKEESTESLAAFLKEYQEHLTFISAVEKLTLSDL